MSSPEPLDAILEMARLEQLYPSLILYGSDAGERRRAAQRIARTLLCTRDPDERPCGACRHCRRIVVESESESFHPDLHRLERDQKTVTSIEATRRFLAAAQMAPFEARGQVFLVISAETLGPEAADTLLKILEEPPSRTPRHFLLLTPSDRELAATLRSRSMPLFLGAEGSLDPSGRAERAEALAVILERYLASGAEVHLLAAAAELAKGGGWDDLRASTPWSLSAAAVLDCSRREAFSGALRRPLLDLAAALLDAPAQRVRGITPRRILEGLLVRHLAGETASVAGRRSDSVSSPAK